MLEVRFFGRPAFAVDGIRFGLAVPPKALLILAHLLLHRDSAVSRDAVAFTIWPDDTEDEARAKLRKYLYRLIKALPEGASFIRAEGDTLVWNGSLPLRFDVAEFETAFANHRYDEAIELYGADLLEGFYDDWVLSLRERFRADFFAALDERLLETRRARDLADAQRYARRILAADPWREDVVRALMTLRYENGDRAGALRLFDEFATRAREEMDVTPMSDTVALREAIIRGTLQVRDQSGELERRLPQSDAMPLYGREDELKALRRAWQRAARGSGRIAILSGEAGIGKTRLAGELALIAESEGARVLWGAALAGATRPYQAIAETVEQSIGLFADIQLERPWLDALTTLIPSLRDVVPTESPVPISPEREQHRLIDAIVRALLAIAAARPTVLVLEDMQWASVATCLAVERLADAMGDASLLLVLTHRVDEAAASPFARVRNRLLPGARAQLLALGRLDSTAVAKFLQSAGETVTSHDVERIEQLTGGNPLMIVSTLRSGAGADATVPARQLLLRRFADLSEQTTHFAEVAAIAGPRFSFDLVREVVACPEHDAFDSVNALQDARIVEERPGAGAFEFRFTHDLLRDALYERVDSAVRARRHGRVAHVLERLYGGDLRLAGQIAEHYLHGGDAERASVHFLRAADYAMSVFAHAEARALAHQALAAAAQDGETRRRALWIEAEASWRLGEPGALREALASLERIEGSDYRETCRILRMRSELEFAAGDRGARLRAIDELERIASERALPDVLAAAHVERVHSDLYAGAPGALEAGRREALQIENLDPKTAVRLLAVLCTASTTKLADHAATAYASQAQSIADRSGDPALQSIALKTALNVAHQHQDYPHVRELALRMIDLARSVGDSLYEAGGYAYLANASYGMGDVASTRHAYAEALSRLARVGDRANFMRAALNCSVFECEAGLLDESREHALQAQAEARFASDRAIDQRATLVLATIENEQEHYSQARALLDPLLAQDDIDPQTRTGLLEESGRTAIGERDYVRAISDLQAGLQGFESLAQRWYARRARAELALANALAGHIERARELSDALQQENVEGEPAVFAKAVELSVSLCDEALATA